MSVKSKGFPLASLVSLYHALCPQRLLALWPAESMDRSLEQERLPAELPQAGGSPNKGQLQLWQVASSTDVSLYRGRRGCPFRVVPPNSETLSAVLSNTALVTCGPPSARPLLHKRFFRLNTLKIPSGRTPSVSSREEAMETLSQGVFPVTKIYIITVKHFPYGWQ